MARRLGPLEITLIVVDVVLIGVLIALIATAPRGPDEVGAQETTAASSSAPLDPETEDETGSPSSTQAVTVPADALDIAEFQSPSGNIWCTISEAAAMCQIEDIDYQPTQITGCEDNELAGRIVQVTAEGAEYPCPGGDIGGGAPADRAVLQYEPPEVTAVGDFMCSSAQTGVTCTNLSSGKSFTITRNGPQLNN